MNKLTRRLNTYSEKKPIWPSSTRCNIGRPCGIGIPDSVSKENSDTIPFVGYSRERGRAQLELSLGYDLFENKY